MARESTVSMWCCVHKDWKHNVENPVCLFCENERLRVENEDLRKSLKIVQKG